MSFLFDSIGPLDVGAYFLLRKSSNAFATCSASVAIAFAVGACPLPGARRVYTSHLSPSGSGGIGRGGAVFGDDTPQSTKIARLTAI